MIWKIICALLFLDFLHQRNWCWKRLCLQCKISKDLSAYGIKKYRQEKRKHSRLAEIMRMKAIHIFHVKMEDFLKQHRLMERVLNEHIQLIFPPRYCRQVRFPEEGE